MARRGQYSRAADTNSRQLPADYLLLLCSGVHAVPSADLHLWSMVLAVAAAGPSVAAAGGGLLAGFQSKREGQRIHHQLQLRHVRSRPHHQGRPARQEATPSQAASELAGTSARTGEPGRYAVRMPDTGTTRQEPNSLSRDERYRAARREPVPRRRV